MRRELRERRDHAAARHDAALERFPTRQGDTFRQELRSVVDELTAIAKAADTPTADPVEAAKTYRWLGDAYFDLGLGKDESLLTRGSQVYKRAEELLGAAEAPVEKAKLAFNYANTLRGLSQGADVGLLEAAQTRYESAARTFRKHHLPDLAATVEEQLRTIEPQLRLARKQAEIQRGYGRLEALKERLGGAGAVERDSIAHELEKLRKVPGKGDLRDMLQEALGAVHEQVRQHPDRVEGVATDLGSFEDQIEALDRALRDITPKQTAAGGSEGPEGVIARILMERLTGEVVAGHVPPDRAVRLHAILTEFTAALAEEGDDLASMSGRAAKMRDLLTQAADMAMSPSWTPPHPEPGSRAHQAISVLAPLKRHLLAEQGRGMLPSDETSTGTDLFARLVKLEASIREAAQSDERVSGFEDEVWRLALEVQEHARRYHLIVAQPDFPTARMHVRAKSLFLSGGDELRTAAEQLATRYGCELLAQVRGGDYAQERWRQLYSASVAVFDLGVPEGRRRAQVCYEVGLALALGRPIVVATRQEQWLPFDIELRPVRLLGERTADADVLFEAVQRTLGSIVRGGAEAGLGSAPRQALAWLDRRFHRRLSDGSLQVAVQLAQRNQDDAVAFRRSLGQLFGMLGADAPVLLLPAWPPAYPDPMEKPRCFHVMPFGPLWAKPTRDLVAKVCDRHGWIYTRGDEAEAQRIIPGIWNEIGRPSGVLVDITGHNPNVALELGLVHALGRQYRVVAQGDAKAHMFESLEKLQIHCYGEGPRYPGLTKVVEELLASAVRVTK